MGKSGRDRKRGAKRERREGTERERGKKEKRKDLITTVKKSYNFEILFIKLSK